MATFIQLVNDLERESGTIYQAQRLATVSNAPGRQEKMVEWVREAWRLIQTSRSDWRWMKAEFEGVLVPGQRRYSAADLGITDFASWMRPASRNLSYFSLYDPAIGASDETSVLPLQYDDWRMRWDRGVHVAGRPSQWSVDSGNRLCVGPKPDRAYVFRGEYRRSAQTLTNDSDVPLCPEDFHAAILWRAMMLMAGHDEATNAYAHAQSLFTSMFRGMVDDSAGVMMP